MDCDVLHNLAVIVQCLESCLYLEIESITRYSR